MRKVVLVAVLLLSGPGAAWAKPDRWVERDPQGRKTGSVERTDRGDLVRRDAMGRKTGTAERERDGYRLRDAMGRTTGKIERDR